MSGDGGEFCHREGPPQALPLQVEVHQVLVCEHQRLGVLVLQVVQHRIASIAALVHVCQCVLPSAELALFPCTAAQTFSFCRL